MPFLRWEWVPIPLGNRTPVFDLKSPSFQRSRLGIKAFFPNLLGVTEISRRINLFSTTVYKSTVMKAIFWSEPGEKTIDKDESGSKRYSKPADWLKWVREAGMWVRGLMFKAKGQKCEEESNYYLSMRRAETTVTNSRLDMAHAWRLIRWITDVFWLPTWIEGGW